jgi:hypothetical protein
MVISPSLLFLFKGKIAENVHEIQCNPKWIRGEDNKAE